MKVKEKIKISDLELSIKDVTRVYSGKPGCMCGCRGKYYSSGDRGFKNTLNNAVEYLNKNDFIVDKTIFGDNYIATKSPMKKNYVIYFKKNKEEQK